MQLFKFAPKAYLDPTFRYHFPDTDKSFWLMTCLPYADILLVRLRPQNTRKSNSPILESLLELSTVVVLCLTIKFRRNFSFSLILYVLERIIDTHLIRSSWNTPRKNSRENDETSKIIIWDWRYKQEDKSKGMLEICFKFKVSYLT